MSIFRRQRRKDSGRPGNGGKFDQAAGKRSSATLEAPTATSTTEAYYVYRQDHTGRGIEHDGPHDSRDAANAAKEGFEQADQVNPNPSPLNPRPAYYLVAEKDDRRLPVLGAASPFANRF